MPTQRVYFYVQFEYYYFRGRVTYMHLRTCYSFDTLLC